MLVCKDLSLLTNDFKDLCNFNLFKCLQNTDNKNCHAMLKLALVKCNRLDTVAEYCIFNKLALLWGEAQKKIAYSYLKMT